MLRVTFFDEVANQMRAYLIEPAEGGADAYLKSIGAHVPDGIMLGTVMVVPEALSDDETSLLPTLDHSRPFHEIIEKVCNEEKSIMR